MFEVNPSRKISNPETKQSDNITQQRAFLNEPQDSLELSTHKGKKSLNFGAAIHNAVKSFLGNNAISSKAVNILSKNGLIDDSFKPQTNIYIDNYDNFTDMPTAFQRKLAIDMYKGEPNKSILNHGGLDTNVITCNSEGKPEKIEYYEGHKLKHTEEFEYAHKQDGSPVLIKQKIYTHDNGNKTLDNEIKFHKHHNGAVTISTTDGRKMSYSLRKETIRDYNNNLPTPTPIQTTSRAQQVEQKTFKPFIKPCPTYPSKEWSYTEKQIIDNKFEGLKREFERYNKPDDEYAFQSYDPVIEDLNKVKELILNTKDPILQKEIIKHLQDIKDNDLDTEYRGNYKHVCIHSYQKDFATVYELAKLGAFLNDNAFEIQNNRIINNIKNKLIANDNSMNTDEIYDKNDELRSIADNDNLSDEERKSEADKVVYDFFISNLGFQLYNLSYKKPELKKYLSDTYLKPNLQPELIEDLEKIEKASKEIIIPYNHSNLTPNALENFHKLPEMSKEHYLKQPDMCKTKFLYDTDQDDYVLETAYDTLKSLNQDEWKTFEDRNLSEILDVITGFNVNSFTKQKKGSNIRAAIEMSDATWQKINDFGLLSLGIKGDELSFEKYRNLTFDFDEMQTIVDELSYKDWENAKKRGLTNTTINSSNLALSKRTNYDKNMSIPLFIASAKAPDSTFNYLKNIGLFKEDKVILNRGYRNAEIDDVARGIDHLSQSHGDVYNNVNTLIADGIAAPYAVEIAGVCAKNYGKLGKYLTEKTLELNKQFHETKLAEVLPMYVDFQSVKNKTDINELSIEEKRTLLKNLIKYNAQLFGENSYDMAMVLNSPILPSKKEEYCSLLPKLIKSIGIDTREVSKETIDNFDNATNSMANKSSEFLNTKFTKDFHIDLDYPRNKFIKDIQDNVANLPDTEKMKVYDYFGFDLLTDRNGTVQMHGYPINVNNGHKLADIKDENTKQVIENVRPLVEQFSNNNKVNIAGKPELTKQLNDIVELFPEFRSIIGKEQHETHDFSVDIHTLKVLQGVMSDSEYQKLSSHDKQIINIATILHDLTKAEKLVDKTHAQYSAYDAYHLLNKMNMSEKDKQKIYQIIKNHEWLAGYNSKIKTGPHTYREKTPEEKDKSAKDIAFELKDENNFTLAKILTKADMKAVKETDYFFDKYETAFNEAVAKIDPLIDNLQKTAIHLPQTKLPKASELIVNGENVREYITKDKDGNEIKNKIVYLTPNMDLGALGFEKGLNSNDLNVIVHALDYDSQSATFQALGSIDSDSLLSSSYINYQKGNYHVFRPQGFILDVNSNDIQAGTYKDFGSGYGKDLNTLKSEYLFNGPRKNIRNFLSDNIKKEMNLSDEEYKKLYPEIADKSITELDKSHPKVAKSLREIFNKMDVHKRRCGRDYNEWLVSRPKIQGVFIEGYDYRYNKEVPEFLAKYAAENDLPIIFFGE